LLGISQLRRVRADIGADSCPNGVELWSRHEAQLICWQGARTCRSRSKAEDEFGRLQMHGSTRLRTCIAHFISRVKLDVYLCQHYDETGHACIKPAMGTASHANSSLAFPRCLYVTWQYVRISLESIDRRIKPSCITSVMVHDS